MESHNKKSFKVKLNPHITIYPIQSYSQLQDFYEWYKEANAATRKQVLDKLKSYLVEEKMYTREELLNWAYKNMYVWGLYNGNKALSFEQFINFVNGN